MTEKKTDLSDYLEYEKQQAAGYHNYTWRSYDGNKRTIEKLLAEPKLTDAMLSDPQVVSYPWLTSLFETKKLQAYVLERKNLGLPTTYIDYMGPSDWLHFQTELPDEIYSVSLVDANTIYMPDDYKNRLKRIFSNLYDVRRTLALLRQAEFKTAHISTQTAVGPQIRYLEKDLRNNYSLETFWEYQYFMFRTMYSLADPQGGVMIMQLPEINSFNKDKILNSEVKQVLLSLLSDHNIPSFIVNSLLISIKTEDSPAKLKSTKRDF